MGHVLRTDYWPEAILTCYSERPSTIEKPAGRGPASLTKGRNAMEDHRSFLPKIIVKFGIKVKITVIRK
jgi:hypothetical protein